MVREVDVATFALLSVTASFPFYLYGAWYIIEHRPVTWAVLMRHLRYIAVGLVLTTIPVVTWMLPRLPDQISGLSVLHAVIGVHAYALLVFALTGIARIMEAKLRHDLYHDPDPDIDLESLHEHMPAWRRRLRLGVVGYLSLWLLAYVIGVIRYLGKYWAVP